MYDIIYVPFHCLNFGLYLVRFPVCYKEHLLDERKYLNKSLLKSNYANHMHAGVASRLQRQLCDLNQQFMKRFFFFQFRAPNSLEGTYMSLKWFQYQKLLPNDSCLLVWHGPR